LDVLSYPYKYPNKTLLPPISDLII